MTIPCKDYNKLKPWSKQWLHALGMTTPQHKKRMKLYKDVNLCLRGDLEALAKQSLSRSEVL